MVKAGDESALRGLILQTLAIKPQTHEFDMAHEAPGIVRFMSHTGG